MHTRLIAAVAALALTTTSATAQAPPTELALDSPVTAPVRVHSLSVRVTPEKPAAGSFVRIRVTPLDSAGSPIAVDSAAFALSGTLAGQPLHFEHDAELGLIAWGGIPVATEEAIPLVLSRGGADAPELTDTIRIAVGPGDFRMEKLTVAPRFGQQPDSALAARIERENAMALAVSLASHDTPRMWEAPFHRPRPGRITSGFGNGREFNGVVQSRHMGTDFAGAIGTPVRAANRGVVAMVVDFHLAGNAIYIDHGAGLVTGYFHLSRTDVAKGDTVSRGQVIGRVGATGRVTGPHLHWIARYGRVSVNPVSLFTFGEVPAAPPAKPASPPGKPAAAAVKAASPPVKPAAPPATPGSPPGAPATPKP